MLLFPRSLFSVAISRAMVLLKGLGRTYKGTRVRLWRKLCRTSPLIQFPDGFDQLADLISSFPLITRTSQFVFVPGPLDITDSSPSILPKKPLMSFLTTKLKSKLLRVHFATNPCRIVFCGQELVVYRDDLMSRILRNNIFRRNEKPAESLKRFVCSLSCFAKPAEWR